jgi:hypothetical protein
MPEGGAPPDAFETFLDASARLTGYGRAALLGTGCARDYWRVVREEAGTDLVAALLEGRETPLDAAVVELWYLGLWRGLMGTENRVVSARAYREGLVWDAIGAHPMGAKQQGFAAWAAPPPPMPGERASEAEAEEGGEGR